MGAYARLIGYQGSKAQCEGIIKRSGYKSLKAEKIPKPKWYKGRFKAAYRIARKVRRKKK